MLLFITGEAAPPVPTPTTDITAPTDLTVYRYGSTWVDLVWAPAIRSATRGIAAYKMYVNSAWDGLSINPNYASTSVSATKLALIPDTVYSFYVTAVDSTGVESAASNTVVITTPRNVDVGKFKRRRYAYRV